MIVRVHVEKDYEGTIPIINDMLNTMENKYKEQSFTVLLYTTLANAYRHTRDFDKAFKALAISETLIDNKERTISERWSFAFVAVKLSKIRYFMSIGDYDKAIEYCEDSLRKITMNRAYEFKSYIKFYLAEAYYKNGMRDEFLHSFKYTLYSLITFENDGVLRHIANYEMFDKFLNDDGLCKSLVSTIKEKLQRERA